MTREQVFAAKEMYKEQIKNNAVRIGINPNDYCNMLTLITKIMKKTSSELIIERTLRSYRHYITMEQRINLEIWEDEE